MNKRFGFFFPVFEGEGIGVGASGSDPAPASDGAPTQLDFDALFGSFSGVSSTNENPAAGAGETNGQPPTGTTPPVAVDPAAPMAPQTPAQPPPELAAELATLRGQVEAYQRVVSQPAPQMPQQPQAMPSAAEVFPVSIPDELVQMMGHEDPSMRRRAFEHLGSELGARMTMQTQQQIGNVVRQIAQAIPQMVGQMIAQHQQMQRWHDDFYGAYPQLGATPELKRFVGQQAAQLAQTGKLAKLDDASFDIVAQAVVMAMGGNPAMLKRVAKAVATAEATPAHKATGRPAIATGSARTVVAGDTVDPNSADAVKQMLAVASRGL